VLLIDINQCATAWRHRIGWSQPEAAWQLGVGESSPRGYERGRQVVPLLGAAWPQKVPKAHGNNAWSLSQTPCPLTADSIE
jgi:hypothetical protein